MLTNTTESVTADGQPHRRTAARAAKRGGGRFRCLAAALLVAIAAIALPTPARAQMTPAHCNPSDPLELWCATLTVGFDPTAATIYGYFDPLNYSGTPGRKGSLSSLQFTYKGVTYTLDDLSIDTSRLLKNTRIGLFSWPSCVSRPPPDNGAHGDTAVPTRGPATPAAGDQGHLASRFRNRTKL